jgi:hypothetical protein
MPPRSRFTGAVGFFASVLRVVGFTFEGWIDAIVMQRALARPRCAKLPSHEPKYYSADRDSWLNVMRR